MTREEMLLSMIADYRRKIEIYQTMIGEWERELGGGGSGAGSAVPVGSVNGGGAAQLKKTGDAGEDVVAGVRDYQFFGKSQPDAAKLFLEMVGHPLRTPVILAGLAKGGVKVGGKTDKEQRQNLYTILQRSSDMVRVARDTWGIGGWPGVPKKSATVKESEGEAESGGEAEDAKP
jgi:hypothetical protein